MEIKVKKLNERAELPDRAHITDAGFDLKAVTVEYGEETLVYTVGFGFAIEIPKGYAGFIFPRSSVYKSGFSLANCIGVIDSGYRGEVKAKFYDITLDGTGYAPGDRCAQLIIMPIPEVSYTFCEELSESDRENGAFGSTGLKSE